ncbi:hypothetical protein CDL15_Pgr006023 [Punica granatum]|uniref:Uncharacterized protein n=1 Tax=Punica granatum TaxID=22663 RepID=A0A218VUR3_PUNGR|nr:hypothetical protein CDL15_Pgr006023 [Punica granatum]PKI60947.1 hypothetical protein CRG98_018653 [Punica granatum]
MAIATIAQFFEDLGLWLIHQWIKAPSLSTPKDPNRPSLSTGKVPSLSSTHLSLRTTFLAFYTEDTVAFTFYNDGPIAFYSTGIPHIRLGTMTIIFYNYGS